jgi:hypothetical protein
MHSRDRVGGCRRASSEWSSGDQENLRALLDFGLIAKVTGQTCHWVVPAGTID